MKTKDRCNPRFAKTYDPNHEPWMTRDVLCAYVSDRLKQRIQNGSQKKG